jgi:hypothetical protein
MSTLYSLRTAEKRPFATASNKIWQLINELMFQEFKQKASMEF